MSELVCLDVTPGLAVVRTRRGVGHPYTVVGLARSEREGGNGRCREVVVLRDGAGELLVVTLDVYATFRPAALPAPPAPAVPPPEKVAGRYQQGTGV